MNKNDLLTKAIRYLNQWFQEGAPWTEHNAEVQILVELFRPSNAPEEKCIANECTNDHAGEYALCPEHLALFVLPKKSEDEFRKALEMKQIIMQWLSEFGEGVSANEIDEDYVEDLVSLLTKGK